jgi:hypothetical protein
MKLFLTGIGLLIVSWAFAQVGYESQYLVLIEPQGGALTNWAIIAGLIWVVAGVAGIGCLMFAIADYFSNNSQV